MHPSGEAGSVLRPSAGRRAGRRVAGAARSSSSFVSFSHMQSGTKLAVRREWDRNPCPRISRACRNPSLSLSRARVPSCLPASRHTSNGHVSGGSSARPKRDSWARSHSAAKSGYRSSVKIRPRSASIHAGRVRLALSRATRSESPSDARPQSAASEAFRVLLQEPEGAPSAPLVAEFGQRRVQARPLRCHYDRNSVAESEEADRIDLFAERPWLHPHH